MAVKEKEVKEKEVKENSKMFSFEDLNKTMSKISILGSTMDKSEISKIDEYLDSGNFHLNAALTGSLFKGYPCNRTVSVVGPSGTGKTFLMLNAVKNAQDKGYYIYYYDSENAIDQKLVEKFGIDPKKFFYVPCNTVQEFRTSITNLTKTLIEQKRKGIEIPKVMVALDSAGNLATQKEIDDAVSGSEKSDMTRAKVLKSIFRIIMTPMAECKIPFIFSNHSYQTQDLFSQAVAGGGCLDPDSLVLMSNDEYKKIKDINAGDLVATLLGNKEVTHTWKFNKPRYEVEFEDGSKLITSEDHRFFIGNKDSDVLNDDNWIYVKDLIQGDEIFRNEPVPSHAM
jgi:RecA/RadA recombinase